MSAVYAYLVMLAGTLGFGAAAYVAGYARGRVEGAQRECEVLSALAASEGQR